MGFLNKLFSSKKVKPQPQQEEGEHAVIVHFNYGLKSMDELYKLCDQLNKILNHPQLGEYDGHEIATDLSDGFLYMYGPNAEALFKKIESTLEQTDFMKGASVKLRFGPPKDGVKEITIEI